MQDLIRYPNLSEAVGAFNPAVWRDSGEGGQFFYAVWDSATPAECNVDAAPSLHMADVLVAAHGPLHDRFDDQRDAWYEASDQGNYERAYINSGVSFDTVLLLGTTSISYFGEDYFTVKSTSDLTEAGRALVEGISAALGSEPTFVSYLDT